MLPNNWYRTTLGELGSVKSGSTPARSQHDRYFTNGKWPWVKTMDLNNSEILCTDELITDAALEESSCKLFPPGTLLVAMYGGFKQIGRTGLLRQESAVNQAISAIELDRNRAHPEFVLHWLNGNVGAWKAYAASSRKDPNITRENVCDFPVTLPTLQEQRRIAKILASWDQAIATSESLLVNAQKQMESLLQQLLIKPAASGEWDTRPIGDVSERIQRRARDDEELPVLMISSGSGFVRQDEKYSRFMAGKSVENYIALDQGEFAYNKGNSKSYEFGCVFSLNTYERGLVPNVYVCFKLSPNLHATFYEHLFRADFLHDQLGALVNTGVRNNGLLNIKPVDFLACQVPVPPMDVQHRIAEVLTTAAKWVALQERDLELLKQEKTALMSQLLTGKRRVKLPEAETEAQA